MRFSRITSAALFLLLGVQSALADACLFSSAPRYQLQSDTVEWAMNIISGHSCIRGLAYGPVSVDAVKLTSPPQSGKVTVLGPGFSYAAKPDFQGQDAFTLQVSGTLIRNRGTSNIKVTVSVGAK